MTTSILPTEEMEKARPLTVLKILVAEDNPADVKPIAKLIKLRLGPKLPNIELHLDIVPTLREALDLSSQASATILDLQLRDAGPEEVTAAIRHFRKPVIVMTGSTDEDLLARCEIMGATYVFRKGEGKFSGFLEAIIHCLSKDVLASLAAA